MNFRGVPQRVNASKEKAMKIGLNDERQTCFRRLSIAEGRELQMRRGSELVSLVAHSMKDRYRAQTEAPTALKNLGSLEPPSSSVFTHAVVYDKISPVNFSHYPLRCAIPAVLPALPGITSHPEQHWIFCRTLPATPWYVVLGLFHPLTP